MFQKLLSFVLYKQNKKMYQVFPEVCGLMLPSLDLKLEPVFVGKKESYSSF